MKSWARKPAPSKPDIVVSIDPVLEQKLDALGVMISQFAEGGANGSAALAFMNTFLATACAVLSWTFAEWLFKGKPSMLGAASGAVAGLARNRLVGVGIVHEQQLASVGEGHAVGERELAEGAQHGVTLAPGLRDRKGPPRWPGGQSK